MQQEICKTFPTSLLHFENFCECAEVFTQLGMLYSYQALKKRCSSFFSFRLEIKRLKCMYSIVYVIIFII